MADRRYASAWIYGAVCPGTDNAFALVLTETSAAAMQVFLDRFAVNLAPGVHAALLLDQAGWHVAKAIAVPANVSLVHPPALQPGAQPSRADLAVPPGALPLAPALRRPRRHRRRLLRRLEPPHRGAGPHRLPDRLPLPAVGQDFMSRVSLLVSTGIAVSPELQSEQLCRNSHRPTRRREWRMLRFKSPAQARRLLSAHPMIYGHFRPCRQPMSADCCRRACAEAFRI